MFVLDRTIATLPLVSLYSAQAILHTTTKSGLTKRIRSLSRAPCCQIKARLLGLDLKALHCLLLQIGLLTGYIPGLSTSVLSLTSYYLFSKPAFSLSFLHLYQLLLM